LSGQLPDWLKESIRSTLGHEDSARKRRAFTETTAASSAPGANAPALPEAEAEAEAEEVPDP
jgi:hypothetical protein